MLGMMGIRRRSGGGAVAVVEVVGGNSSNTVLFSATPTDGELIVLVASVAATATLTGPGSFTAGPAYDQGGNRPVAVFWKVAASEGSATYTVTASTGNVRLVGYRLTGYNAAPMGNSSSQFNSGTGTSYAAGSAGIDMDAGSLGIAYMLANSSIAGLDFDNSFVGEVLNNNSVCGTAYRLYPSADTAENTTATWTTTATNRRGLILEILPA